MADDGRTSWPNSWRASTWTPWTTPRLTPCWQCWTGSGAWRAVFGDGSAWRTALRRQSPEALEAGEAIARRAAPFRDVRLPGADLVHMDFGLHNVLFR